MITIVVIDHGLENYACEPLLDGRTFKPLDKESSKEWLSWMDKERIKEWLPYEDSEIYFVNVFDETWNEFKTKNSKRLELLLGGLNELLKKASYAILIKGDHIEFCSRLPKRR